MQMSKELIAASATPLVLSILRRGDSYGYEIIQTIRDSSGGALEWSEGMLYPILHRLEKKGLVESYWGKANTGRRRKYYRLQSSGTRALADHLGAWRDTYAVMKRIAGEPECST